MGYANSVSIMCPTAAIAKGKKQLPIGHPFPVRFCIQVAKNLGFSLPEQNTSKGYGLGRVIAR